MNREEAKKRREAIEDIITGRKTGFMRSVDDWYRIVARVWSDGWDEAPAKSTVKKVLQDMHYKNKISWHCRERGWFRQECFG